MDKHNIGFYIRCFIFVMVIFSLTAIFYVNIVEKNYEIITNPDGPDLEE